MICYLCNKESNVISKRYVQPICLQCDEEMLIKDKNSDEFRKNYRFQHAACPKCGNSSYISTLAGYILDMDNPENYKDLNKCTCRYCYDKHTVHDRVPVKLENESSNS